MNDPDFGNMTFKEFKRYVFINLGLQIFVSKDDYMHQLPHLHIDSGQREKFVLDLLEFEFLTPLPDNKNLRKKLYKIKNILETNSNLTEKIISLFCKYNSTLGYCKNRNSDA